MSEKGSKARHHPAVQAFKQYFATQSSISWEDMGDSPCLDEMLRLLKDVPYEFHNYIRGQVPAGVWCQMVSKGIRRFDKTSRQLDQNQGVTISSINVLGWDVFPTARDEVCRTCFGKTECQHMTKSILGKKCRECALQAKGCQPPDPEAIERKRKAEAVKHSKEVEGKAPKRPRGRPPHDPIRKNQYLAGIPSTKAAASSSANAHATHSRTKSPVTRSSSKPSQTIDDASASDASEESSHHPSPTSCYPLPEFSSASAPSPPAASMDVDYDSSSIDKTPMLQESSTGVDASSDGAEVSSTSVDTSREDLEANASQEILPTADLAPNFCNQSSLPSVTPHLHSEQQNARSMSSLSQTNAFVHVDSPPSSTTLRDPQLAGLPTASCANGPTFGSPRPFPPFFLEVVRGKPPPTTTHIEPPMHSLTPPAKQELSTEDHIMPSTSKRTRNDILDAEDGCLQRDIDNFVQSFRRLVSHQGVDWRPRMDAALQDMDEATRIAYFAIILREVNGKLSEQNEKIDVLSSENHHLRESVAALSYR